MVAIITPGRWREKPEHPLELDPNAPFADFIDGAWLLGDEQPTLNRAPRGPHLTAMNDPVAAMGHLGPYRAMVGRGGSASTGYNTGRSYTGSLSYLAVAMRSVSIATSGNNQIGVVIIGATGGSNGVEIELGNRFLSAGDTEKVTIGGGTVTASGLAVDGIVQDADNLSNEAVPNGKWVSLATALSCGAATSNTYFGRISDGVFALTGGIQLVVQWNGVQLPKSLLAELSDAPYSIFRPLVRRTIYLPATAAGGGEGQVVVVAPAAASAAASALGPNVVLGSVTVAPAASAAKAATVGGAVQLGSLVIAPAVAAAQALGIDPSVVLGSLSLEPAEAAAKAAVVAPDVIGSDVVVTPSPAAAAAESVDPSTVLGSLILSPAIAAAVAAINGPSVVAGSLTISPGVAVAVAAVVDPDTVLGDITLAPAVAAVKADRVNPSVTIGGGTVVVVPPPAAAATGVRQPLIPGDEQGRARPRGFIVNMGRLTAR